MVILYRIVTLAILLGIIVIVHELGHYIAARLMGVRVETFSFGFGTRLFGKKIGDTDFRLSLIPLGGYVKMAGEEDYESAEPKSDEFAAKNRAQKIFILAMGPIMNVVLSFVILTSIYMSGIDVQEYQIQEPVIGYVEKGAPADLAGIMAGDEIIRLNMDPVNSWKDIEWGINANPNEIVRVTLLRDGKELQVDLKIEEYRQLGYAGMFYDFKAKVDTVKKGSAAEKSGLKKGDIIVEINDKAVNFYTYSGILISHTNQKLKMTVLRDKKTETLYITPKPADGMDIHADILDYKIGLVKTEKDVRIESIKLKGDGIIGIIPAVHSPMVRTKISFKEAVAKTSTELKNMSLLVFKTIQKMIGGSISAKNLSGPIEIARVSQEVMESGLTNFFMLIAFISLQLGIINLFPIPALDGGHLLIYSVESIIRRDLPPKMKNFLMNLGFLLLIALMIFVILNDVSKTLPNGWNSFLP